MKFPAPAVTRLAVALALSLATPLVAARGVPAGFEDLVEGQTEQLEVRLFGRSTGLVPVRVTLEHVQLEAPAEALQALQLPAEAQAALLPALSQPLPRNSHLACRYGGASAGCGYIDPPEEPTAVRALYDEGEGAVRLFVARQWIPGEPAAERYHQVSANAENAFLHQHTLNVSGGRGYQSLAAQGMGALGVLQRGHLSADWTFSQQHYRGGRANRDFQLDNAYYRHDLGQQHYLQAGRMDRRNLSSPQGGTFSFSMLPRTASRACAWAPRRPTWIRRPPYKPRRSPCCWHAMHGWMRSMASACCRPSTCRPVSTSSIRAGFRWATTPSPCASTKTVCWCAARTRRSTRAATGPTAACSGSCRVAAVTSAAATVSTTSWQRWPACACRYRATWR